MALRPPWCIAPASYSSPQLSLACIECGACEEHACMAGSLMTRHTVGIQGGGGMTAKCQRAIMLHGGGAAGAHACMAHSMVSCGRPPLQPRRLHNMPPPRISTRAAERAARPIHMPSDGIGAVDERRRRSLDRVKGHANGGNRKGVPVNGHGHALVPDDTRACKEGASHSPTAVP